MTDKKKNIKRSNIIQLFLGIVILLLAQYHCRFYFHTFGFDCRKALFTCTGYQKNAERIER
jgi:hypothetical protein